MNNFTGSNGFYRGFVFLVEVSSQELGVQGHLIGLWLKLKPRTLNKP